MDIYSYVSSYEEVLNQMPAYLVLTTMDNKIAFSNTKTAQLLGFRSPEEISGVCVTQVKSKSAEDAHFFSEQNNLVLLKNKKISTLGYHYYSDWQLNLSEKNPLVHNGKVVGVITNWLDVTHHNLIECTRFLFDSMKRFHKSYKKSFSYIVDSGDINNFKLSNRQMECLFFLLRGKSSKEIGGILNLSPRTVEGYIDEIKLKMDCLNKAQLIEKALETGLFNMVPQSFFQE